MRRDWFLHFSRSTLVTYLIILSPEKYIIVLESLKFWIRDSVQTLIVTTRSVSLSCPGTIVFLHKWLIRRFVQPSGPLFKQRPSPSRAFFTYQILSAYLGLLIIGTHSPRGKSQLSLIRTHLGPALCVRPSQGDVCLIRSHLKRSNERQGHTLGVRSSKVFVKTELTVYVWRISPCLECGAPWGKRRHYQERCWHEYNRPSTPSLAPLPTIIVLHSPQTSPGVRSKVWCCVQARKRCRCWGRRETARKSWELVWTPPLGHLKLGSPDTAPI